jgi:hypothetical protein
LKVRAPGRAKTPPNSLSGTVPIHRSSGASSAVNIEPLDLSGSITDALGLADA